MCAADGTSSLYLTWIEDSLAIADILCVAALNHCFD